MPTCLISCPIVEASDKVSLALTESPGLVLGINIECLTSSDQLSVLNDYSPDPSRLRRCPSCSPMMISHWSPQGAGGFGIAPPSPANLGARCNTTHGAQTIIDAYVGFHGLDSPLVIDTARIYGAGTSEQMLGQIDIKRCRIDTKCVNANFLPVPRGSVWTISGSSQARSSLPS